MEDEKEPARLRDPLAAAPEGRGKAGSAARTLKTRQTDQQD